MRELDRTKKLMTDIRGGFIRAAKLSGEKGRPLSTMWLKLIEDDFALALKTLQGFLPKETNLTVETEGTLLDVLSALNNPRIVTADDSEVESESDPVRH
jgi:hypothetical protein